ncbi:PREDICTED: free fatty acid receptor 2-like [Elephantulus edwardii]|uniref:free fatty acid receptor 2-like n=1 Tax=Elephantulus edwardii TaxID=28737 RepID=UPI0003F0C525|nr:PREDICTED: free fatty acid receptor 2-like [Elephantulus edwardii]
MPLEPRNLGLLFIYVISFLVGLPANLLALRAFIGRVRQPDPAPIHILLLSLTLADLLLLLLLPFKMVEATNNSLWILGNAACALTGYGFYSAIYCSTWLLAGISVERYRSVAFPVQYKLSRRPVYGVIAAAVSWVLSFGHCSIVIVIQYLPTGRPEGLRVCYENFTREQLDVLLPVRLELCLVLFFVPMAVTIFCYWRFVSIVLSRPQVGAQKRWRAVGLAAVTLFNFLVCFGPYNVSHVVGYFQEESQSWRSCAVLFSALNACIDPLIFYFSSSAVRKAFGQGLKSVQNWSATMTRSWRISEKWATKKAGGGPGRTNINFTGERVPKLEHMGSFILSSILIPVAFYLRSSRQKQLIPG